MLREIASISGLRHALRSLLLLPLLVPAQGQLPPSLTGALSGSIFTIEDTDRASVPGARVRIQSLDTAATAAEMMTDALGHFSAKELSAGRYRVTVEFAGLEAAPVEVVIEADRTAEVEVQLTVAAVKDEVTVSAQAEQAATSETSTSASLEQSTLEHAPNATERVDNLLPLIPGVVRGPDGLINMKGARASQSGMLLNSANVTDPVTGSSGMNLPIDVVSSAQVLSNPYDPEYGKSAAAVETVDTRLSSFDKFRFRVQNFLPRTRKRDGSIMGIEAATPRMTLTGPLIRNRVAITQSMEYRFVRTPVNTLPPLRRDTELESLDSYTQVDLNLTERQNASITLAFYPQKLNYLGLNTFTPQESTPDLRQRGHFLAFSHKLVTESGALLASQFSFKTLDSDVKPHSDDIYRLAVETTEGGFFNRQHRDTSRFEWQEVYNARPVIAWGTHQLKAGGDFVRNVYDGNHTYSPVQVIRTSGIVAEQIDYSPGVAISVHEREYTAFVQDKWAVHPRITIDGGVRVDRDSISDEGHAAPRVGVAISPFANGRTVLRGGIGYFYDRINLNIPTFTSLPEQTVIRYDQNGLASAPVTYVHRLAEPLNNPRSTACNLEIQQQVRPDLVLRAGYTQRITVRDFFLEPSQETGRSILTLSNEGRSRYREFQVTARYQFHHDVLNASYVRSSAIGDLNDFNQLFGNTPTPIIRPNERSRLAFDAPNRFLLWGQFEAPWNITISPVLDVHTGFPYSVFDEERDFIGQRNKAGRFPRFSSTDLQVTKEVKLPMRDGKYKAQVGVRVFNMFNHYNPRDIQADIASTRYGVFLNSVDRVIRGKFVLEF